MVREPLIPILKNLEKMRAIASKINELDWEPGTLAGSVLIDTQGGRELEEFRPTDGEFMGVRMPYVKGGGSANSRRGTPDIPLADDGSLDQLHGEGHLRQARRPRTKIASWERTDHWRSAHVTTAPAGPAWEDVTRRKVYDMDTEEMIEDVEIAKGSDEADYQYEISSIEGSEKFRNIRTVLTYRAGKSDVCEVYSPPRIVEEAARQGMRPGFSLDLTVQRKDEDAWDFSRKRHRDEATRMVVEDEPFCLIGSPPCTMFSILQNGNKWRFTKRYWDKKLQDAEVPIHFCLTLYEIQRRAGRYYLHEHPRTATSWKLKSMGRFEYYADIMYVDTNMCQFGMVTNHKGEKGLVESGLPRK